MRQEVRSAGEQLRRDGDPSRNNELASGRRANRSAAQRPLPALEPTTRRRQQLTTRERPGDCRPERVVRAGTRLH